MLVKVPWWVLLLLLVLGGIGVCEALELPAGCYWFGAGLGLVVYAGWRRHGDRPIFHSHSVMLLGFKMLACGVVGGLLFKRLGWSSELGLALGLAAYGLWFALLHQGVKRASYSRSE